MTDFDQELDTSGLNCPMPVMKASKALRKMDSGQVLHLISTDSGTNDDIPGLVDNIGASIIESSEEGGVYHIYIKKD